MADEVTIAGEGWLVEELEVLAALVAAARALFRSSELVGELRSKTDPLRRTVDGRLLWALATALDGPHDRREAEDPAPANDGAEAA